MKKLVFLCFLLSLLVTFSTCNQSNSDDKVTSYIYISQVAQGNHLYMVDAEDYQTVLSENISTVSFTVLRSNMAENTKFAVNVNVSSDVVSGTEALPNEAYELSKKVEFAKDQRSANIELKLNLSYLQDSDNRDKTYSITLVIENPTAGTIDSNRNKVKVVLNTEKFLKNQGLYYKWLLDFEDNFDGSGSMTDYNTESWGLTNSPGHGNIGLRRAETVTRENGMLVCGTYRDPSYNNEILSSHMFHKKQYLHGRFEFRARIEDDPNECVGGVILTWPNHTTGAWPRDGELDIYETFGTSPGPLTFIHYGTPNGSGGWNDSQVSVRHPVRRVDWTIMAMEWTADALRLYRNGKLVWTLTDTKYIPKIAHYFAIQSGPNNQKLPLGQRINLYVDWVKIYTPAE